MLDMKFIREHAEEVKENLVNRHNPFDLDHVLDLDQKRRELLQQTDCPGKKGRQGCFQGY